MSSMFDPEHIPEGAEILWGSRQYWMAQDAYHGRAPKRLHPVESIFLCIVSIAVIALSIFLPR